MCAVACLSRLLGSDQSRQLRGENGDQRAHRFPLFAAVLQFDGEHTRTSQGGDPRKHQGATGLIAAIDHAR